MTLQLDAALATLARDPSAPLDLAELGLLLARDEYPFLDVEAHLNEIAAMTREVRPYLRGHLAHQVQGLCRYLFHEMGFRGNERDYYDPRNSYLNQVLERRLGIPISLSTILIAVGSRAGMNLVGVGLPGHFIVKAEARSEEILIDPFNGGRILSLADCEQLIQQSTGAQVETSALSLEAIPTGLIIRRMLGNLKAIYWKQEDWPRSTRVLERLRLLSPEDAMVRRDLGLCYAHRHHPGKAIDHLRAYLDAVPDADDADAVRKLLKSAIKMVAQWN